MENSPHVEIVSLDHWTVATARLHGIGELPPPAAHGECMECDEDGRALWLLGDFVLCLRCTVRRRVVAARLAAASPP